MEKAEDIIANAPRHKNGSIITGLLVERLARALDERYEAGKEDALRTKRDEESL
jgi:hypothetical protein